MGLKVALHGSKFVFNRKSASILLKTHKSLGKRFIKRTNLSKSSETVGDSLRALFQWFSDFPKKL